MIIIFMSHTFTIEIKILFWIYLIIAHNSIWPDMLINHKLVVAIYTIFLLLFYFWVFLFNMLINILSYYLVWKRILLMLILMLRYLSAVLLINILLGFNLITLALIRFRYVFLRFNCIEALKYILLLTFIITLILLVQITITHSKWLLSLHLNF